MLVGLTVTSIARVAVGDSVDSSQDRWIIEAEPETKEAHKLGAADVQRAQQKAKAKEYRAAVEILERVVRAYPAALHDCNLALAYLRDKQLTKARLFLDVSSLRGGTRPAWCTGDVSKQLSRDLEASGFVPTTIEVAPLDAVVEVGGVALRGIRTVWLPPLRTQIVVSAPGYATRTEALDVKKPSTRVALTLEPPLPVVTPDAVVDPPVAEPGPPDEPDEPDAPNAPNAPNAVASSDAALPATSPPPAGIVINNRIVPYRYVALTAAVASWAGAGVVGGLTLHAKRAANAHYPSDPEFANKKREFDEYKWVTAGATGVAAIATAVTIYLFARGDDPTPARQVGVSVGDGSVGVTFGGGF
jgi:hypothetical protein